VTNGVEQMAQAADGVARGSQEQAQSVQKTSVLINEMADVVDQVEKITGLAVEGDTGVQQEEITRGSELGTIRTRTAIAVRKVKEMGLRSKEIGRIVEAIDDIADKTDMLALNAAVEAARAGEHGRGFAVVADQVRKLSEDSKEATRDINQLIERVQGAVDEAISSAEGAADLAEQISTAMVQLKQKSEGVVAAIESVGTVVEENTAVSEEMAANSQEMTDAMSGVVSIAEENSASAEEMAAQIEEVVASAEELSALAEQLREATAQFELGNVQYEEQA
jgi:methyl-accepting chemotaxis protein